MRHPAARRMRRAGPGCMHPGLHTLDMAITADQVSYEDLYARWEAGNWRATGIDLSVDRDQWENTFTEFERRAALWTYSMFFHGEDAVADNLSPYIDAAPREEQKYFLATQQADEARHAVLFGRFMREVAGHGQDMDSSLEATRPGLTWGFRKVFERLDRMADELRRDRSRTKLAQAIALYHLVIEAELAQPGQHFIDESLTRRDLLPGFREGIRNVSRDEQRHIAFGVKMIADLIREDPDCVAAIEELLREVLPFTSAVFVPPDWDRALRDRVWLHAPGHLHPRRRRARREAARRRNRPADAADRAAVRPPGAGAGPPRAGAAARCCCARSVPAAACGCWSGRESCSDSRLFGPAFESRGPGYHFL